MCNGRNSNDRRGLIVVVMLMLFGWRGAGAGLYTMEQTLADFAFDDASIVYGQGSHKPSGDQANAKDDQPDAFGPLSRTTEHHGTGDGLRGILTLQSDQGLEEDLVRGRFNVFGSLPKAESHPNAALLTDALDKMDRFRKTSGGPAFWNEKDRMAGSLATKYRGYGIYFSVAGLDELTWINEMRRAIEKGGDIIDLSSEEDTTSAAAIPTPGTPALLLLGGFAAAAYGGRRR